jgi:hypothetical protein
VTQRILFVTGKTQIDGAKSLFAGQHFQIAGRWFQIAGGQTKILIVISEIFVGRSVFQSHF